jgi:hypothetical protein
MAPQSRVTPRCAGCASRWSTGAISPAVARLMGAELGWDDQRIKREIDEFFRTQALRISAVGTTEQVRCDRSGRKARR